MKRILTISMAGIACMLMLASCGTSTRVVSQWQAPEYSGTVMNNVLVLGMMNDRETKDNIEQTMVRGLAAHGVMASTGTAEFGPKGFGDLTQANVNSKLRGRGYTAIMIVCLIDKDKDVNYVPGSPYISPYGPVYYGYYGRYRYMYDNFYNPGYYTTSTTYTLDADIYSLPDDKLIYSAQAKSYDPSGSRDLAESFSEEIIQALVQHGLIR